MSRRLIDAVFEALQARAPEGVSYMVIELGEGSFVHLKSDAAEGAFELGELPGYCGGSAKPYTRHHSAVNASARNCRVSRLSQRDANGLS